jgi:Mg2+/Co2+ transporter CorC
VNETVERINRAQEVADARIRDVMLDRAELVLNNLVARAAAGTLTDREAAVGVFVICELRKEAAKAQRIIQQGIAAGESLTKEPK